MSRALESILLGLPRYEILNLRQRKKGIELRACYRGPPQECPRCGGTRHWIKDRFLRTIRHENWGRMWRYTRSNAITEGFHNKIEVMQRRAYGYRNFQNLRLRVKVLCG